MYLGYALFKQTKKDMRRAYGFFSPAGAGIIVSMIGTGHNRFNRRILKWQRQKTLSVRTLNLGIRIRPRNLTDHEEPH